jgi:iron complex transport system ATP-binding protein
VEITLSGNRMLTISNLNFAYQTGIVLNDISLNISASEFVGIIGPNGAGKSTLLKSILGLVQTPEKCIQFENKPLLQYAKKELGKNIAYVPQETDFVFSFSVKEIVRMGRFPYSKGISFLSHEDEKIVNECMITMEIKDFSERKYMELSGGEKQRVVIASALAQEPKLLLLDEPTSALDLHHQLDIYKLLKNLQKENHLTTIVVTHGINLAAQFCDRIILMDQGSIIKDGKPEEVLQFNLLQEIFGVKVYIDINPMNNSLYILPYD